MFETLVSSGGYWIIFILMIAVGIFGIFPPSKIIYGVAGFLASSGTLSFLLVIFSGALGHSIGNFVQYELGRRKGFYYVEKFLKFYPLFTIEDVKKIQAVFEKRGVIFLFFGKILDPIKLVISFCAGIAKMNRLIFFSIVFVGSLIWALIFSGLGFYFGQSYEEFGYIGAIIVGLGIVFILILYKYMNSKEIKEVLDKKN